jgi:RimJ/RimL family protein N-acetyltransferase
MVIYGDKIKLRAIESEDNEFLLEMMNDPDIEMMVGGYSQPESMAEQMKWFTRLESKSSILRCIIANKENDKAIGTLILNDIDMKNGTGHIHIKIANGSERGKGYGTDAINTMVKYAFSELRLNCVFANILAYNEPSVHLFEKCGFTRDGILRARVFKQGQYVDLFSYSRLSTD